MTEPTPLRSWLCTLLLMLLVLQSRDRKGVGSVILQILSPAASHSFQRLQEGGPKPKVTSIATRGGAGIQSAEASRTRPCFLVCGRGADTRVCRADTLVGAEFPAFLSYHRFYNPTAVGDSAEL